MVKYLFFDKVNTNENMTRIDNNNIIVSETEIAEKLNIFM